MLESAREKLHRAKVHIQQLVALSDAFARSNPYRAYFQPQLVNRQVVLSIESRGRPDPSVALVFGDAIHNLCCALDHLTWEIVGADVGVNRSNKLQFPRSRGNGTDYRALVNGMNGKPSPRPETLEFFRRQEVYRGGRGQELLELVDLDAWDKHTRLVPMSGISQVSHPEMTVVQDSGALTLKHAGHTSRIVIGKITAGTASISLPTGVLLDVTHAPQVAAFVGFENIEPFGNEPIAPRLASMCKRVEDVIEEAAALLVLARSSFTVRI